MKVMGGSLQCWHPLYSECLIAAGVLSKLQPSARYNWDQGQLACWRASGFNLRQV